MKKYNYIYRIDNLINNKFYIGVRSTDKLPEKDNYYGSGQAIKGAIKKYKKQNFSRTILFVFSTREEANLKEKEIVTLELVQDINCYNLYVGGSGVYIKQSERKLQIRAPISDETRRKISETQIGVKKPKHSIEANKAKSERLKGEPNLFMKTAAGRKVTEKIANTARTNFAAGARIHHYKNKTRSEEDRAKISAGLMGNIPWNKGIKLTLEQKQNFFNHSARHVLLNKELIKIDWTYEIFKKWVIDLFNQGLGPIKILKTIPPGCKMSATPIKNVIKEYKCQILLKS